MLIQSYNAELAIANLMFLKVFNNIRITRVDKNGNKSDVKVQCQFGQSSRIYKNWQNAEKKSMYKLPMIVIDRTGYSRNPERLNNMHNEVKYELTSKYRKQDLLTAVPIDVSYDVTVMSIYPSDIDQIASNFMVFFNGDGYVTCFHPKFEGIKMNNQIVMSDSITEEHPSEFDGTADDLTTATFQFTFKTYLFGGTQQAKPIQSTIISSVMSTILSSYVVDLGRDIASISSFLCAYPEYSVSSTLTANVSAIVPIEVKNPDLSSYIYNGFTPIIKKLDFGFYAVPQASAYNEFFMSEEFNNHKEIYGESMYWRIDETLSNEFPNNIIRVDSLSVDKIIDDISTLE